METIESIKTRRSVREFTDREVDDKLIEEIIDTGRWAPSGLNNQAWRFIVVRNKDTKDELSELTHYLGYPANKKRTSERRGIPELVYREEFGLPW